MLHGRAAECARVDELLAQGREGRSGVLVVRGGPGIGKSALLEYAASRAEGYRILSSIGVQSEAQLAWAAAHQLLHPVLDRLPGLHGPQGAALAAAFGLADAEVSEGRFLISAAVLGLLADVAEDGPLLCLIDDAQWLDTPSADAITFAARRVQAEGIVLLIGARDGDVRTFDGAGLPQLPLTGLDREPGHRFLEDLVPQAPAFVREALIAGTAGNPLGLRELALSLTADQMTGAAPLPDPLPVTAAVEEVFLARVRRQPEATQELLLVAAAEHLGAVALVLGAAERLGLHPHDLDRAERAGLVHVGAETITFEHPLVRSAVYRGATFRQRQAAHRALAEALDVLGEADRRVWHLAAAATGPDETTAAELERSAERAQRRGAHAAAAAAFHQAAGLSRAADARARRFAAAGTAAWRAGQLDRARELLHHADTGSAEPASAARVAWLRGMLEFRSGLPAQGYRILREGVDRVAPSDPATAARMLGAAAQIAWTSGELGRLHETAERLAALGPLDDAETMIRHVVQGFDAFLHRDHRQAARLLRRAVTHPAEPHDIRAWVYQTGAAVLLGDDALALELSDTCVAQARSTGQLEQLPQLLVLLATAEVDAGRFAAAAASAGEGLRLAQETGQDLIATQLLGLLAGVDAVQGRASECRERALAAGAGAEPDGAPAAGPEARPRWPPATALATRALALLALGAGRSGEALTRWEAVTRSGRDIGHEHLRITSAPDLVEVAVRTGRPDLARDALAGLESWVLPAQPAWGLALVSRCLALLTDGDDAERHYREALELHAAGERPFDTARTELLLGEWLRRRRRRSESREHLRRACHAFDRLGAEPWADRARNELRATGETVGRRDVSTLDRLTPQELQIARAVSRGATNRDVAAQLFLSPRTVDYHLHKVFAKLGVSSRRELILLAALQDDAPAADLTRIADPDR